MARLSQVDKYTIEGMVANDKTPQEISRAIGKGVKAIKNYIDQAGLNTTAVSKIKTEQIEPDITSKTAEDLYNSISPELLRETISKMISSGFTDREHCIEIIKRVAVKAAQKGLEIPNDPRKLCRACTMSVNAKDVTITEAVHGQKGVAILTEAASQRGDESKAKTRTIAGKTSHKANTIWRPKDGKFA